MSERTGRFGPALIAEDKNKMHRDIFGKDIVRMGEGMSQLDYNRGVSTAVDKVLGDAITAENRPILETVQDSDATRGQLKYVQKEIKISAAVLRHYEDKFGHIAITDLIGTAYGTSGG